MASRSFTTRNRYDLLVPAVGRPYGSLEDELEVLEWDRVGLEPSDRALREDGFAERHRQPAVVHVIGLLEQATRAVGRSLLHTTGRLYRIRSTT